MEKNIFEGAYLGKVYKTRNGRKAIYIYYGSDVNLPFIERHHLIYEGLNSIQTSNYEEIVSEWQEEIDEGELDRIATEALENINPTKALNKIESFDWGFKEGYRKALNK